MSWLLILQKLLLKWSLTIRHISDLSRRLKVVVSGTTPASIHMVVIPVQCVALILAQHYVCLTCVVASIIASIVASIIANIIASIVASIIRF